VLLDMGAEVVVGKLRCAAADWRAARRPHVQRLPLRPAKSCPRRTVV
jgi:hypothetical protein